MAAWCSSAAMAMRIRPSQTGVELDSQFRIASVSKPLTATAILKLVEQGKVSLDNRVFDILPPTVPVTDPRIFEITVRQLLEHKGGWDRDGTGYDPMFRDQEVSASVGKPLPIQCADTIQHMMGRALDFDPGLEVLVLELRVLRPRPVDREAVGSALRSVRQGQHPDASRDDPDQLGASAKERAAPHEVTYVDYPGAPLASHRARPQRDTCADSVRRIQSGSDEGERRLDQFGCRHLALRRRAERCTPAVGARVPAARISGVRPANGYGLRLGVPRVAARHVGHHVREQQRDVGPSHRLSPCS